MVDASRPAQLVVEAGLSRIAVAGGEDAVGDRARDEHVGDALGPESGDVAVRIERPSSAGVDDSAATVASAGRWESIQACAATRVSVRVNRESSPIAHTSGTINSASVNGASARWRPASTARAGTSGITYRSKCARIVSRSAK